MKTKQVTTPCDDENFQASKESENSSEANAILDNNNAILQAINGMKTEFSSKLDGVLSAINSQKSELLSCQNRIAKTEERISNAEDGVVSLQRRASHDAYLKTGQLWEQEQKIQFTDDKSTRAHRGKRCLRIPGIMAPRRLGFGTACFFDDHRACPLAFWSKTCW